MIDQDLDRPLTAGQLEAGLPLERGKDRGSAVAA